MTRRKTEPKQRRVEETAERLLSAAQAILAETGLEAFNSNAIAQRAGLTPPTFYRYFDNKHAVLTVLGKRLMEAQNAILHGEAPQDDLPGQAALIAQGIDVASRTLDVTKAFVGGSTLIAALRAIPELRQIRLDSHETMARVLAERFIAIGYNDDAGDLFARCRLVIEIGYAAIEMLCETGFENRRATLEGLSRACAGIFDIEQQRT